jgi:hypothetical protein
LVRDPTEGQVDLALNARNCFDGVEEVILGGVLDASIDEKRVSFGVDILHHDLEIVEAAVLGYLDFGCFIRQQSEVENIYGGIVQELE